MKVSVVIPAYNEELSLPLLRQRLTAVIDALAAYRFEIVLVDDHSDDATPTLIEQWTRQDGRARGIRLARRSGSHIALTAGLNCCTGDCAVLLAADLQDPPELLRDLLERWQAGYQVVWAVRAGRPDETRRVRLAARLYWLLMRRLVLPQTPTGGADVVLLDRVVIDALARVREKHTSLVSLLMWLGFRQTSIAYVKSKRVAGRSGWTLSRRLQLALDSFLSFTTLPVRLTWLSGLCLLAAAGVWSAAGVVAWLTGGVLVEAALAAVIGLLLLGFGLVLTFAGMLGEYLWRAYDQVRGRPSYLIEQVFEPSDSRFVPETPDWLQTPGGTPPIGATSGAPDAAAAGSRPPIPGQRRPDPEARVVP